MRFSLQLRALLTLILTASQIHAHPPGRGPPEVRPPFDNDYESRVCRPILDSAPNPIPPCMGIEVIETICTPNGTSALALRAHQQCMCNGSFFAEWPFCLQCLSLHGLQSQRDVLFLKDVIATASSALCDVPTPTADFKKIFRSVQAVVPMPTTGVTISSDQAVGQTAVSLYYTASGSRGPGMITGAATAATATGLRTAPGLMFTASQQSSAGGGDGPSLSPPTATGSVSNPDSTGPTTSPVVNTNNAAEQSKGESPSIVAAVVAFAAMVIIQ